MDFADNLGRYTWENRVWCANSPDQSPTENVWSPLNPVQSTLNPAQSPLNPASKNTSTPTCIADPNIS